VVVGVCGFSRFIGAWMVPSLQTHDGYELIVERHRTGATVLTSNREPLEWLGFMADALLAQSAIDRLQSAPTSSSSRVSPTAIARSRG